MQTENHKYDCERGQRLGGRLDAQGFDIQAIGLDTRKRHGELAEARFLAKASSLGFGVAKPWGEERYDFVLDSGYSFWRVQVKSTRGRTTGEYEVRVAGGRLTPYDETEIDFLVAYLVPEDIWYVIPVKMLKGRRSLYFSPWGRGKSKWEKYREGWCQMACPHDENGPSKIVTPRCRDKGPVQMAICPLKVLRCK
jgi:PD-(D/E)XK nuclease superfamily protein